MPDVHRLTAEPDLLGESPVWDARHGCLYWIDGVARRVRRLHPASGERQAWTTPSHVGSIGLTDRDDVLVAALADGVHELDLATGATRPLFRPEPVDPRLRFNDGKVARDGAFLCGSMGLGAEPLGRFHRVTGDGSSSAFGSGIRISNAICFGPDGRTAYFADSLSGCILASAYEPGTGPVGRPRVAVETARYGSGPDGATVDADGALWVALVQAGRIARFTPDGALDRTVDAPTDLPSSLAFGGPDMRTLFVTSIRDSGTGRAVARHPAGGHLFAIEGLGVQGIPEPLFRRCAAALP